MTTVKFFRYDNKPVYVNPDMVCTVMELSNGFTKMVTANGDLIVQDGLEDTLSKLKWGHIHEPGLQ